MDEFVLSTNANANTPQYYAEDQQDDLSSDECLGEEEEEEDEEECATDEISEDDENEQQPTTPRKPLPQHRPQLPIVERTHNNKRRGRTPGCSALSIGTAASAIKRVRGIAGIRATKCTSVGTATGSMGKSKSIVSSLRKNRRAFAANTNPIFLHNSSSDDEEEEEEEEDEEDEEDDMVRYF